MPSRDLRINLFGNDVSASRAFHDLGGAAHDAMGVIGQALGAGGIAGIAASLTSTITGALSDAGSAMISELKSTVVDYNGALENAQIGFTTMLGSGQKAQAFLSELQQFAKATPFGFGDLTSYAQQMLAYGISAKEVIPDLTALGDAAASAGKSSQDLGNVVLAFEQMAARGKVDLGDMNQLTAGGVPALKILASSYGVTTGAMLKMISSGTVMSQDALPRLTAGIEKGTKSTAALGGMMTKQSNTFQGAMSNISDAMDQTLSKAGLPFFKVLEKGSQTLAKFASSKQLQKWANDAAKAVGNLLDRVGTAFNAIAQNPATQKALADLGTSLQNAFKAIGPALDVIIPNVVQFANDVLPALIGAFQGVIDKIPTLLKWWTQISQALAFIGPAVGAVITWLSNFGGTLFNVATAIKDFSVNAVGFFNSFVSNALTALTSFGPNFVSAGASFLEGIVQGILGSGNPIASALSGLVANAAAIVTGQINGLHAAISNIGNTDTADINSAKSAHSAGVAAVAAAAQAKAATIVPAIASSLGATSSGGSGGGSSAKTKKSYASIVAMFKTLGTNVGKGLQSGLLGTLSQVQDTAKKMRTAVESAFTNGYISKSRESATLSAISSMTKKLSALAKERASVLQDLSSLKADRSGVYNDTKSSTIGSGDPTTFGGAAGDAVRNLQQLVSNTKKFKTDLTSLVKKGIDQTTFGQLVSAWQSDPTAALASANGLLSNPTDLKNIISLQSQLSTAASSLGGYAGHHEYDSKVNAAAGKAKVLGWEMQAAAKSGLKTVSHDLHVHVTVSGTYAGTKESLAKSVAQVMRDEVKKGTIPKNWATA